MDTPKQGWTPFDIYTTGILLQTVKEIKKIKSPIHIHWTRELAMNDSNESESATFNPTSYLTPLLRGTP